MTTARVLSKNSFSLLAPGGSLLILVLLPGTTSAHRLDEYLQATRVDIARDRVNIDVDLTPGVSIARQVAAWIDVNANGEISPAESLAYATQVLESVSVSVDGSAVPLYLVAAEAPPIADMSLGVGTMRVRASANISSTRSGRHSVSIINTHHPETSVYLANALVPTDKVIHIREQRRSEDQHSLTIEYAIGLPIWPRVAWLLTAVTLLVGMWWMRHRLDRLENAETPAV